MNLFMKQRETISAALSDASVVLQECSNKPEEVKIPLLIIMTPHRAYPDQEDDPPMSVKLNSHEVCVLYNFLHNYYSANDKI